MNEIGNYVLRILHDDDVTHYEIVRDDHCPLQKKEKNFTLSLGIYCTQIRV
jgi:hypothetical protein